ncbi:MAG TPA: SfnB family sulfur acquisition oxidoreductase [Solirubrobacteraceae bacterium]|jgi:SfnB family sulfur acquisition oxidoreductase|nr:SfnB family sulfur acquisition oxidoreductase [Solirubrobacteraceae bacterium]
MSATTVVISSDLQALEVARGVAGDLAVDAAARDLDRRLPRDEIDALSASGLLGITVPREFGGAEVSSPTLAEVFRILAAADPNVAQIPQSHFVYVNLLRELGSAQQRERFFGEILDGRRLGNAQAEMGRRHVLDISTQLSPLEDGSFLLDGIKHYCTGALFADWITVLARGSDDRLYAAFVAADAYGVEVIDDWDGMGQRTTASGQVRLDGVSVPADQVLPYHRLFEGPQTFGATAQLLHAAIDVGIARGALQEAAEFVRERSRPWWEAGVEHAADDPLVIQRFGELAIQVRAAETLLADAADQIDRATAQLDEQSAGAASIAVASAKAFADRVSVETGSALFELCGTRSALDRDNLNRHWRNARTHTLHDPVRWKIQHIGRYTLSGTLPPRHGQL